ncbi:PREDICTED: endoglin, partial [Apaloderma vittatum]|uniref:endoglin n=1 Tax=Apaloderma vittatum TaxID=57397 RepID=UPI0005213AF5
DSAVSLNVSVTSRAGGCAQSVVLVLLCARCSATIKSCLNLRVCTVNADSPSECVPQGEFNAMPHLETEVVFHEVKGCSRGDAQSTKAAHIVRLDPKPSSITKVDVSLSCPKRAVGNQFLILQSRANLTWFLSLNNCNVRFLVSGSYRIMSLSKLGLFPGELLPDTEQGLVNKAFEKNCSVIASYSAIPVSTHISLEIQEHEMIRRAPVMTTSPPTSTQSMPKLLLPMLRPWKCTDETMEIVIARSHLQPIKDLVNISLRDSSCQAEKNATHFMLKTTLSHCGTSLEDRGHANNENTTMFEKVLQVMVKDGWQPPNSRGLGLAAVLGITFGAFLIGA